MSDIAIHLDFRLGRSSLRWLLCGAMVLAAAPELGSESVTLTTYYPAPSGIYTQMITTNNTYLSRDSGNVGIGTTSPGQKLDVRGNVLLPNNGSRVYLPEISANTSFTGFAANANGDMIDGVPWYLGLGREPGAWNGSVISGSPYPDMVVNNHTGVRLAAHGGYGGVSIYEQLNTGGSQWSSAGAEVARFRDSRYGGTTLNSTVGFNTHAGVNSANGTFILRNNTCSQVYFTAGTQNCPAGTYATTTSGVMNKFTIIVNASDPNGEMLCCPCPTGVPGFPYAGGCPSL